MIRANLDGFPVHDLPVGYRFRTYRSGDCRTWTELQRAAEPFLAVGDDLFEREFGARREVLPDRMFYVVTDSGQPVGTITAWWQSDWRDSGDWGQIHWVAVHPNHQRRGISKAMMSRAMQRLAHDHRRAMLGTSTGRVWALKLYLDFGFQPDPGELQDPRLQAAWREVQAILHHPLLEIGLSR